MKENIRNCMLISHFVSASGGFVLDPTGGLPSPRRAPPLYNPGHAYVSSFTVSLMSRLKVDVFQFSAVSMLLTRNIHMVLALHFP